MLNSAATAQIVQNFLNYLHTGATTKSIYSGSPSLLISHQIGLALHLNRPQRQLMA